MSGREGSEMVRFSKNPSGDIPQAPAVSLHQTVEVTPKGVGICAAGHPRHQRRLCPVRRDAAENFLA